MTTTVPMLWAGSCVLPGCSMPVEDVTQPCHECLSLLSDVLVPVTGPRMTPADVEKRDVTVRAVLAQRVADEPERKRNQLCWLCEERRTCVETSEGWECDDCQEVQP